MVKAAAQAVLLQATEVAEVMAKEAMMVAEVVLEREVELTVAAAGAGETWAEVKAQW